MDDGFKTDDLGKLQQWFFAARMARFARPAKWRDAQSSGHERADFEKRVAIVYTLCNRCSHQEHLSSVDEDDEVSALDLYIDALDWIARKIDPDAAEWIRINSRVNEVRAQRPVFGAADEAKVSAETAESDAARSEAATEIGEAPGSGAASKTESATQEIPDPAAGGSPATSTWGVLHAGA